MLIEEEVETVGEGVHEVPQPRRARGVLCAQRIGIDEQLHPQILVNRRLALRFRKTAQRIQVVRLDPVEIVLGLRVLHAEHGVRIGFAVHVRDAPVVADDRDALRLLLPAGDVALRGGGLQNREETEDGMHGRILH